MNRNNLRKQIEREKELLEKEKQKHKQRFSLLIGFLSILLLIAILYSSINNVVLAVLIGTLLFIAILVYSALGLRGLIKHA